MSSEPNKTDTFFRHAIAWTLLFTSVVGLVVLACVVVAFADNKEKASSMVFNALLPVFGTWVGTLLAFYFSKENLDAATKNMNELSRAMSGLDKLKVTTAIAKAIPFSGIFVPRDAASNAPLKKLQAIVAAMKTAGRMRLIVFTSDNRVERVVHQSVIEGFISDCALKLYTPPNQKTLEELTVDDLFAVQRIDKLTKDSFAVIPKTATLADAKTAMDQQSKTLGSLGTCEDVFITESGGPDLPVLGWITDTIIVENAKV